VTVRPFISMNRRTFFLALLPILGRSQPVSGSEHGFVLNAARMTDGGDEGVFAIGQELCIVAKAGTTAHREIGAMVNGNVDITIFPSKG
jgi:hypothetical protein